MLEVAELEDLQTQIQLRRALQHGFLQKHVPECAIASSSLHLQKRIHTPWVLLGDGMGHELPSSSCYSGANTQGSGDIA